MPTAVAPGIYIAVIDQVDFEENKSSCDNIFTKY
jgi:hypothetical protein